MTGRTTTNESSGELTTPTDTFPTLATVRISPARILEIQRDPLRFMLEQQRRHGSFIHYPLGWIQAYQASHPAVVQHILQDNNRNYSKDTIQYNTLSQITGRGLLTSDGRLWLRQRRLVQPAFHRRRIEAIGSIVTAAAEAMLQRWQVQADQGDNKQPIDVDAEMMQVTLEIIGRALFNLDLRRQAPQMTQAVLTTLDYVVYRAKVLLAPPLSWPTPRHRRVRAALDLLDGIIYDTIAQRRRGGDGNDVLSMLLQARDEKTGEGMSDVQIRDEMMTLIIAGHETVASALTWCWYLLWQHPAARQEMEAELRAVLNGRTPTVADLPHLPFTRAVFAETLRLYPPAWLITRRTVEADRLGQAVIPAGALIILSPYLSHRLPDFWPQPQRFDPGRFLADVGKDRPRYAYIPFGGGPRLCIGDSLALMEGQLILATVAQHFRLDLVPGHPVRVDALVTLRPGHGLPMTLAGRTDKPSPPAVASHGRPG